MLTYAAVGRALSSAATPQCEDLDCASAYETHAHEEEADALKEPGEYSQRDSQLHLNRLQVTAI